MTHIEQLSTRPTRPVIQWYGGKWLLAPWIVAHLPPHRIYVEPFGGAASVLLRKTRSNVEVYNDLDDDIVNLFRVLRDNPSKLIAMIELTPFARDELKISREPCNDPIERARRLCVRAAMSFGTNGHNAQQNKGFRQSSANRNVLPVNSWRSYPGMLPQIVERFRGVIIENHNAIKVMKLHDSERTLHYVDPPYVQETRSTSGFYVHEMNNKDHCAMADFLHKLSGMVVLSGYRNALYEKLFGDWETLDHAAFADGARSRTETLWFNKVAWWTLHNKWPLGRLRTR